MMYYRFLHPKSTEISLGLRQRAHMGRECLQQGDSSFSLGDKSLPPAPLPILFPSSHPSFSLSGIPGSLLEHPGSCGVKPDGECRHHHWLLIRLALKTGDPVKINRAYGAGGRVRDTGGGSEGRDHGGRVRVHIRKPGRYDGAAVRLQGGVWEREWSQRRRRRGRQPRNGEPVRVARVRVQAELTGGKVCFWGQSWTQLLPHRIQLHFILQCRPTIPQQLQ